MKHPMQPIVWDDDVIRFRENKAVSLLLETSKLDLNDLSLMHQKGMLGEGDYTQLMQLIGYSVCSYGSLSTSPPEVVKKADHIAETMRLKGKE